MNLRKYLFTSSFIAAMAVVFVLLIAAGCAVILQKQVNLKQQSQPNPISSAETQVTMSSDQCTKVGGRVVNSLNLPKEYRDEDVIGEITDMRCPCVCVRQGN